MNTEEQHDLISESRGRGLTLSIESVCSGGEQSNSQAAFLESCRERGFLVGEGGVKNHALRLGPPLTVTHEAAEEPADIFEEALAEVGAGERVG
jgi:4-aminobutyrate aminotransferase-like enzyme